MVTKSGEFAFMAVDFGQPSRIESVRMVVHQQGKFYWGMRSTYQWFNCLVLVTRQAFVMSKHMRGLGGGHNARTESPSPEDVHNHVIKWKQFPRYWPFVRGIHR